MLEGAINAEGLDNIKSCISDSEKIFADVEGAVIDLEKHTAADTIAGLKLIAAAVIEMKSEIKDCEGVKADWIKLEKMAEIFASPTSFAYHVGKDLLVNGV